MARLSRTLLVLTTAAALALPGCSASRTQFVDEPLADPDDSSLYDSVGLYPEIPAVSVDDPFASAITVAPITINEDEPPEYWDVTLEEAVRLALSNSRIMRDLGATVLKLPTSTKTLQDPAIMETDPRFGVEAALSHFDTHFATSGFFEKNDRALNNVFFGGGTRLLQQDGHVYQTQLRKRTATGAELSLTSNTDYDSNNAPGNLFFASWTTNIEAQVRQPLLAHGGVEYNRIYGPNGIPGLPAGVMLARVNTDMALTDFEVGARNFVSDIENAYWDLYFAYRELDARILARDAALDTWRRINALHVAGRRGGEAQNEAQAREQFFRFQEEVQNSLVGRVQEGTRTNNGSSGGTFRGAGGVHMAERRLRLMMGIHISDGRLIRPADEPKLAKALFEWEPALAESLTRRPELRKQKWLIKRREMEIAATKNLLNPRLDAVGRYRWRGFGKDLLAYDDPAGRGQFASAWGNLLTGNFQEWQLGFEFEVPFGFRHAHNAVRNYELQLAREQAILQEQEREVVLDLSNAVADLNRAFAVLQTNHNRRISAKQQLAALLAIEDPTPQTLYLELESQRRLADAEVQFYRALVEHELAVKNVHFEKGSLLDYNGVVLAELPWPDKAYQDAYEKIRLRTRTSRFAERVVDGPDQLVSDGPVPQSPYAGAGVGPAPAMVPAPAPAKPRPVEPAPPALDEAPRPPYAPTGASRETRRTPPAAQRAVASAHDPGDDEELTPPDSPDESPEALAEAFFEDDPATSDGMEATDEPLPLTDEELLDASETEPPPDDWEVAEPEDELSDADAE